MTIKDLYNSTKELKPAEKAMLVDMILIDLDKPDSQIEGEWIKVIVNRKKDVKAGKIKLRSYQQVMGKYK
jgi:hypothetical protein